MSRELLERDRSEAEAILAHELAHVLHTQRLGTTARELAWLDDSDLVRLTLDEGTATVVELEYRLRHLHVSGTVASLLRALPRRLGLTDQGPLPVFWGLHYVAGARYVEPLRRRCGWGAVDDAFRLPPETTSEILHPDRAPPIGATAPPLPPADVLGEEARRLQVMEVGEMDTRTLAQLGVGPRRAARAAAGATRGTVAVWRFGGACDAPCRRRAGLRTAFGATAAGDALRVEDGAAAVSARGDVVRLTFAPTAALALHLLDTPQ